MRIYADDTEHTVPVQWYFVPASNRVLPFVTPFYPKATFKGDRTLSYVLGDDPSTIRPHSAGLIPRGPGVTFCGNERQWTQGASISDPIPPINVGTGLPCCCGPAVFLATGGGVLGGTALDTNFLAQENLSLILQEDGSRIYWG